jgi:hypothetical protein
MAGAHGHTVLLVGWPEERREAVAALMGIERLCVCSADSATDALECVVLEPPCLVLVDVDHGVDGPALRRRMLAVDRGDIPTAFVTALPKAPAAPSALGIVGVVPVLDARRIAALARRHCTRDAV